jgi:hypothetical protein
MEHYTQKNGVAQAQHIVAHGATHSGGFWLPDFGVAN